MPDTRNLPCQALENERLLKPSVKLGLRAANVACAGHTAARGRTCSRGRMGRSDAVAGLRRRSGQCPVGEVRARLSARPAANPELQQCGPRPPGGFTGDAGAHCGAASGARLIQTAIDLRFPEDYAGTVHPRRHLRWRGHERMCFTTHGHRSVEKRRGGTGIVKNGQWVQGNASLSADREGDIPW